MRREQGFLGCILLAAMVVFVACSPAFATVIHVRTDGDDANDGLSWATAKQTVQAGLDAAGEGDEVWVAAGLYLQRTIEMPSGRAMSVALPRNTVAAFQGCLLPCWRADILVSMKQLRRLVGNLLCLLRALGQLFSYGLLYCWALLSPKAVLAARLVASESQLGELYLRLSSDEGRRPRFRFSPAFRLLWSVLSRLLDGWDALAHLMKPETVVSWHRTAFRLFWRWRSKPGRKPVGIEMQQLIRRISEENPLWGPKRIRDTLLLLGYEAPCEETIRKYMVTSRRPHPETTNWLAFLRNHVDVSWAIDFFTVTTLGFQTLYVFLVFDHARREVLYFAVTPHPTMEWVIQQLRDATPFGRQPRYLFRDNDGIFGYGVRAFLESCGIREVRTAYKSPWQNPYVERMIGTLRRELLDHIIVLNQRHLERLLREYLDQYYHTARPHQGLGGETPAREPREVEGELVSVPVVGGLHHRYLRRAA